MALIECQDCGAQVSDRAQACPKCGGPMAAPRATAPIQLAQESSRKVYTTEQTGKPYKSAQLIGGAMLIFGLIAGLAGAAMGGGAIGFIGLVVYLGARVGGWWDHG